MLAGVNRPSSSTLAVSQAQPTESTKIEESAKVEEPAKSDVTTAQAIPEEKPADNEPVTIAQNTAPEVQSTPPATLPETTPDNSYKTLPKTASNFWEVGLIGLGSIIAAGGVRKLRRQS